MSLLTRRARAWTWLTATSPPWTVLEEAKANLRRCLASEGMGVPVQLLGQGDAAALQAVPLSYRRHRTETSAGRTRRSMTERRVTFPPCP